MAETTSSRLGSALVALSLATIIWLLAVNMNTLRDNTERLKLGEVERAAMRADILQNRSETLINRKLSEKILQKQGGGK